MSRENQSHPQKLQKKKKRISDTSKKQKRLTAKKMKSPKVSAKKKKMSRRASGRPALSPKSAKKAAGLSTPLKRGLRTSPRNTTDVWSFDDANSTSVRVTKRKKSNTGGVKVKSNRKGGKKIATRKNTRSKDKNHGVKIAKKSLPKRETRDERRQRKQKEVIEQVNVFDFDDVADPYA